MVKSDSCYNVLRLAIAFNRDACDWLQYSTLQKHVNKRVVLQFETRASTQKHTGAVKSGSLQAGIEFNWY